VAGQPRSDGVSSASWATAGGGQHCGALVANCARQLQSLPACSHVGLRQQPEISVRTTHSVVLLLLHQSAAATSSRGAWPSPVGLQPRRPCQQLTSIHPRPVIRMDYFLGQFRHGVLGLMVFDVARPAVAGVGSLSANLAGSGRRFFWHSAPRFLTPWLTPPSAGHSKHHLPAEIADIPREMVLRMPMLSAE